VAALHETSEETCADLATVAQPDDLRAVRAAQLGSAVRMRCAAVQISVWANG
jgi:hypothetical protein